MKKKSEIRLKISIKEVLHPEKGRSVCKVGTGISLTCLYLLVPNLKEL